MRTQLKDPRPELAAFAARVRQIRKIDGNGHAVKDFCDRVGVKWPTWSSYENGTRQPVKDSKFYNTMRTKFNIRREWLAFGTLPKYYKASTDGKANFITDLVGQNLRVEELEARVESLYEELKKVYAVLANHGIT